MSDRREDVEERSVVEERSGVEARDKGSDIVIAVKSTPGGRE